MHTPHLHIGGISVDLYSLQYGQNCVAVLIATVYLVNEQVAVYDLGEYLSNQSHIKSCASPGEPRYAQGGREGQNAQPQPPYIQPRYQVCYDSTLLQRNNNKFALHSTSRHAGSECFPCLQREQLAVIGDTAGSIAGK